MRKLLALSVAARRARADARRVPAGRMLPGARGSAGTMGAESFSGAGSVR